MKTVDIEYLRDRLTCNFDTGLLFWKDYEGLSKSWRNRYVGKEAFTSCNSSGYMVGKIDRVTFQAHRVIWALYYGAWPDGQIDHVNGVKAANRISNLRVVTNQENLRNQQMRRNNTSGVTGVYWHKGNGAWKAQIMVSGKYLHLGYFDSLEEATGVRSEAAKRYGFSERHGT